MIDRAPIHSETFSPLPPSLSLPNLFVACNHKQEEKRREREREIGGRQTGTLTRWPCSRYDTSWDRGIPIGLVPSPAPGTRTYSASSVDKDSDIPGTWPPLSLSCRCWKRCRRVTLQQKPKYYVKTLDTNNFRQLSIISDQIYFQEREGVESLVQKTDCLRDTSGEGGKERFSFLFYGWKNYRRHSLTMQIVPKRRSQF